MASSPPSRNVEPSAPKSVDEREESAPVPVDDEVTAAVDTSLEKALEYEALKRATRTPDPADGTTK